MLDIGSVCRSKRKRAQAAILPNTESTRDKTSSSEIVSMQVSIPRGHTPGSSFEGMLFQHPRHFRPFVIACSKGSSCTSIAGSVGPNMATTGVPTARARCINPESLHRSTDARRNTTATSFTVVRPTRLFPMPTSSPTWPSSTTLSPRSSSDVHKPRQAAGGIRLVGQDAPAATATKFCVGSSASKGEIQDEQSIRGRSFGSGTCARDA